MSGKFKYMEKKSEQHTSSSQEFDVKFNFTTILCCSRFLNGIIKIF